MVTIRDALTLAADYHLFQTRDRNGHCEYRDHNDTWIDADAVRDLIAFGWIGDITGWETHGQLVRRRLDVSEGGLAAHLSVTS